MRMLTDRGTEYCGRMENHPYQLYLNMEDIEHSKTRPVRPQSNGIEERFHRTIQSEFYDVAFRTKVYEEVEELQKDVDIRIEHCNNGKTASRKILLWENSYADFFRCQKVGSREKYRASSSSSENCRLTTRMCQILYWFIQNI